MIEAIIRLFCVFICGFLGRFGGMKGTSKLWRRLGCTISIVFPCVLYKNWLAFGSLPLLFAAFTLGYGDTSSLMKKFKNKFVVRAICGLAYSIAVTPILWGNWWALGTHILITTLIVTLAGNQLFKMNDQKEEAYIWGMVGFLPIMAG